MTYCSIEEAWGTHFNKTGQSNNDQYQNIVPDNADSQNVEYANIPFEEVDSKRPRVKRPDTPRTPLRAHSFRRTKLRLPEHSGPADRYEDSYESHKDLEFEVVDRDRYPKKILKRKHEAPSDLNADVPISDYNDKLRNQLYEEDLRQEEVQHEDVYSESDSEIETFRYVKPKARRAAPLRVARRSETEATPRPQREHIFDIAMYVLTGIFIIFILDLFVKLGKSK